MYTLAKLAYSVEWLGSVTGGFIKFSNPDNVGPMQYSFLFMFCCFVLICLVIVLLQLAFLVDVFRRDFGKDSALPFLWVIVMVVGFPLGAVFYYFFVCNKYPLKGK